MDIIEIILFMLPAYIANSAPVLLSGWGPLDRKALFGDGNRILGDSKTIRGTLGGIVAGILVGAILSYIMVPVFLSRKAKLRAFLSSSLFIGLILLSFAFCLFPNFVYSPSEPHTSLNVFNSSSSGNTLFVMLMIALMGMPLVLVYTFYVYRVFKGKVSEEDGHY
ncbi:MAG: CDP-archaeol synthase [Candidatus Micrarchaeota archaeon]